MSSYSAVYQVPEIEDLETDTHSEVLFADTRLDQSRVRAAVDAVFEAHPELGTVFEPFFDSWTSRPGGGWTWAVEPRGVTVAEVFARQCSFFDKRIGRLFAVSLLPGSPDRLLLTASRLCLDSPSWETVVDELLAEYHS
ncbi:hypothetical protein [Mycobacterium sp.]|uniref:hypothetical protein n=1 Tax=Mycobacterium sp. TaxID=1785 RepID=UPI002CCE37E0|nr:hypothetical protein [Mycobacterium sp.]HTQ19452.1 hypothetical protein [Mycobacterium sp.]